MRTGLKKAASLVLAATALLGLYNCKPSGSTLLLPVFFEKKLGSTGDTVYHTVANFSLTNQDGKTVTRETMRGHIVVANFFFATCQSICPEMSTNLTQVQKAFEKDDSLLIFSHSVNPLHDTVEVLKNYAGTYGAKSGKWHLLTGSKKEIYTLALKSYQVNALEDDGSAEGFLHSELFLLVDTQGRIRGMYDGTSKPEVDRLIGDIKLLKKEKV